MFAVSRRACAVFSLAGPERRLTATGRPDGVVSVCGSKCHTLGVWSAYGWDDGERVREREGEREREREREGEREREVQIACFVCVLQCYTDSWSVFGLGFSDCVAAITGMLCAES